MKSTESSHLEIDLETAAEARNGSAKKDLGKVLPKLAKRINSTAQVNHTSPKSQNDVHETPNQSPNDSFAESRNRRKSRSGSIFVKPAEGFSAELEELRTKDIQPDVNSAADRALSAAIQAANAHGTQRESHRYDKNTFDSADKSVPKNKVEGREIQQDHAQYALTYGMMLGIRVTTGRRDLYNMEVAQQRRSMNQDEERELSQSDFDYALELAFPPEGSAVPPCPTPPHKLNFQFKFKDYMANVFRAVRAISGINEADYMMSLAGDFNYIEFIANSKSGQFFFYSHDGKYMIKTQTKEESLLLRAIMPQYVAHLNKYPDSLLVRFYGMHRVKMKSLRSKIHFVIMSSVFDTDLPIHAKYDLKGSTIGRLTDDKACAAGAVQKDLNLMRSGRKLRFGAANVRLFRETLVADVTFLRAMNIMDYSLLVGIHNKSTVAPQRRRSSGVVLSKRLVQSEHLLKGGGGSSGLNPDQSVFQSCHGGVASAREANEIYFIGIIDILQLYNTGKKMETFFKGFTSDKTQLSSVDPGSYANRMVEFITRHTDYSELGDISEDEEQAQQESGANSGRHSRSSDVGNSPTQPAVASVSPPKNGSNGTSGATSGLGGESGSPSSQRRRSEKDQQRRSMV